MLDQMGPHVPAEAAPTPAAAEAMFRRMLAAWVLDCARLKRRGLDRPALRTGRAGAHGRPPGAGPTPPALCRGG